MGAAPYARQPARFDRLDRAAHFVWSLTSVNPIGQYVELPDLADVSIHIFGTWGSATLVMAGTNEYPMPTDYAAANEAILEDHQGNSLSFTSTPANIKGLDAITRFVRPQLNVVGVAAALTVALLFHRPTRGI